MLPQSMCVCLFVFKLVFVFMLFYQLVISLSILVLFLFNILSHTNILLRFLSRSFSVTLNVILYFTNRLLQLFYSISMSTTFSLSHCNVCFYVSASFVFCIILDSVQSVFDLLCWLLFVKHTFNSSILYCICFPFFLSCFYTSVFVYVCVCLLKRRQMAHHAHRHTATQTHMRLPSLYRLEATN